MTELLTVLAPLLMVDVLNPVLFAVLVFAAGSSRPLVNSSAMLLGHTLAYFVVGLAASVGIEKIAQRLANPQPVDFVIEFLLGLACLYSAFASRQGGASEPRSRVAAAAAWRCASASHALSAIAVDDDEPNGPVAYPTQILRVVPTALESFRL